MDEEKLEAPGAEQTMDPMLTLKRRILAAALPNVAFDGWTDAVVRDGAATAGVSPEDAKLAFPRGGVDLALFFHDEGDRQMADALAAADLATMRMRDRVTYAVRRRLEIAEDHREAVRRGATLYTLPIYAPDGARAVWRTADTIWTALGDPSEDVNWYTKRAILASVYGATTLFWLGDESDGRAETWAFLSRRIEGVMRFEKVKGALTKNPIGRMVMAGPNWLAKQARKPGAQSDRDPIDSPGGA